MARLSNFHLILKILCFLVLLTVTSSNLNATPPVFNGQRAFSDLVAQCAFGPRNPGSEGHTRCRLWLVEQLKSAGFDIYEQHFTAVEALTGVQHRLVNIVGHLSAGGNPLALCAHWDTRANADEEPDPAHRGRPIIGANDGASGVAVLLEIARLAGESSPPRDLVIVFFDGEDMGRPTHSDEFAQGSRFWAAQPIPVKPNEGILLDMVGDSDLNIGVELYSEHYARGLRQHIWELARRMSIDAFTEQPIGYIADDHLPLNQSGIRTIDIIDSDYPHWHKLSDTPEQCSPESLNAVGSVLVRFIWGE